MKKLLITIAIMGLAGGLIMANGAPAVNARPGRSIQMHQKTGLREHMGNNLQMTKSQQTARLDYEMSQAIPNLSERQQRRIHRLNKKYVNAINKNDEAKNGNTGRMGGQMGGGPMGSGMGGQMGGGPMGSGMEGQMNGGPMGGKMDSGRMHKNGGKQHIASRKGSKGDHDMLHMSDSMDFEAIEKVRAARETYDKSVKKVLNDEQFKQYKVYEKHKIMMMTMHKGNGNKPHMMNNSGMVKRMDNNIARAVKSLSDSQIKAIHELNSGFVANREKMRGQMRQEGNAGKGTMHEQMTKSRKEYETSLKGILTSDQYQQYESFQKVQRTKGSDKGLKGGYNKD